MFQRNGMLFQCVVQQKLGCVNTDNTDGVVKNHCCLNGLRLDGCMCRKFVVCVSEWFALQKIVG